MSAPGCERRNQKKEKRKRGERAQNSRRGEKRFRSLDVERQEHGWFKSVHKKTRKKNVRNQIKIIGHTKRGGKKKKQDHQRHPFANCLNGEQER